jgi:diguanylate cyclase (GGDEF)-like protein
MAIVSIKRYLANHDDTGVLRDLVASLISKLGECAVEVDRDERENLRSEIGSVREALTPSLPIDNLHILADSALGALDTYNRWIERKINRQAADLEAIVRMLQNALIGAAGGHSKFVGELLVISEELERSLGFKDLQSLKAHLGTCLSGLRDEIEREKSMSKSLIEQLRTEIESFRGPGSKLDLRRVDPATGALLRDDCVAAMQEAIDKGTRHYAVVMVVDRVQQINDRFGRQAGDRMLARFKEHVEIHLLKTDRLFRWTGPAFLAILEPPDTCDHVRLMLRRILDTRLEETHQRGGRSVLIPISAVWSIFAFTSSTEAMEEQIEAFIAGQTRHDHAQGSNSDPHSGR